eukprot:COSAG01_NODE_6984_length_3404_cov_2.729501_2_plen_102_part_00
MRFLSEHVFVCPGLVLVDAMHFLELDFSGLSLLGQRGHLLFVNSGLLGVRSRLHLRHRRPCDRRVHLKPPYVAGLRVLDRRLQPTHGATSVIWFLNVVHPG